MEYVSKFFTWLLDVTGIGAFTNNTLMCSGMLVIETVMCLVLVYTVWNVYGIIMGNHKKDELYSIRMDKTLYMGVFYYVLKFAEAYLYAKCI